MPWQAAQANTGLRSRDQTPRVFVIASTSGGTGSGMALDVAYALRMLLLNMGLSDNGVCGILTHSSPRKSTGKDLATANTYALLNELFHYSRNHFPGEPACGLRAFGFGETDFPAGVLSSTWAIISTNTNTFTPPTRWPATCTWTQQPPAARSSISAAPRDATPSTPTNFAFARLASRS